MVRWIQMLRVGLALIAMAGSAAGFAQNAGQPGAPPYHDLEAAIEAARKNQVDLLAPRGFAQAVEELARAREDYERGRNPKRIASRIAEASATLAEANKSADIARVTLETTLRTRADAVTVDAATNAPEVWSKASERFTEATIDVERGDVRAAQRHGAEAEVLFRDAELAAIKGNLLNEARRLIAQADDEKVERWAPRTLAAAKKYLADAEREIEQNRYDTDLPRSLAQQARYEARHALYLAQLIRKVEDDKNGIENLILAWEEPLRKMASELDVEPRFDEGFAPALDGLLAHVQQLERELQREQQLLGDREAQVTALTSEMERLEQQLGGVSEERIALQRRVDAQARLRADLATIEGMFKADEARVLREGDDVVLRVVGLNFPVGKATIDPSSYELLDRVEEAIRKFPDAAIVVEGHTDSYGSDSANFVLSQERADAVRQYLVNHMGLNPERVSSIGYGETRPVATNDTAEGRARNRRIDLVLRLANTGLK